MVKEKLLKNNDIDTDCIIIPINGTDTLWLCSEEILWSEVSCEFIRIELHTFKEVYILDNSDSMYLVDQLLNYFKAIIHKTMPVNKSCIIDIGRQSLVYYYEYFYNKDKTVSFYGVNYSIFHLISKYGKKSTTWLYPDGAGNYFLEITPGYDFDFESDEDDVVTQGDLDRYHAFMESYAPLYKTKIDVSLLQEAYDYLYRLRQQMTKNFYAEE